MLSTVSNTYSMSASSEQDQRFLQLKQWLATISAPNLQLDSMRPASTDASFRRYFRVDAQDGSSYIAMDAPPPQEDVKPFMQIGKLFKETGLSVPEVLASETELGFLLLTDLGTRMYLHELTHDSAHKLYMDAIEALVLMQVQSRPDVLPNYDRAFLQRELDLFPEWYIGKHLGAMLTELQAADLKKVFDNILANVMAQAPVYVHRDYHSRNLMVLNKGNPGILDFQGALFGPITYDLASLLRDAYIRWDEEMVLDWAIRYWEAAKRAGLPVAADIDNFYMDFEYAGLQRHLKILGIFSRLAYRDGKTAYLDDIPLVLEYVRKVAQRYIALKPLLRLLDTLEQKQPQVGYTF